MLKDKLLIAFLTVLAVFCSFSLAKEPLGDRSLFSPSVAERFYEIARESESAGSGQMEAEITQSLIFLKGTAKLDNRANYAHVEMINLLCEQTQTDNSVYLRQLLGQYVNDSADLEIVKKAIRYMLDKLNSREEREELLKELVRDLGPKNALLSSELYSLLGVLSAEKADLETAQLYFLQAYTDSKYNKLAFSKLAEISPEQVTPAMYLEQLRLTLGENLFDLDAALGFANYAEQLQLYDTANNAYEYCRDLFGYLYPSEGLPAFIYMPWAISCYNTERTQHKCLKIADDVRRAGGFNLLLEAVAGKAAIKIGESEKGKQRLESAQAQAEEMLRNDPSSDQVSAEQLAWFYCFGAANVDKALDWANRAYSADPNSASAAAILAYSLVLNGQTEWAQSLIDGYEPGQISDLTLAKIQLAGEDANSAIVTLKSAIAFDPGSIEAEQAKKILAQQGGEYIQPIDSDIVLTFMENSFGQSLVPEFSAAENIISLGLNARGNKFTYTSDFGGSVVITNNHSEPLIIGDNGLLKGNIRVDARISGDIERDIANLISFRVQPSEAIKKDRSLIVPVKLVSGELREILLTYPQASLNIDFTAYIDPVTIATGEISNSLVNLEPATISVERPGIELTTKFLQTRFNSLAKGKQGQKIKTAELFAGLLAEQQAMANREPLYKLKYGDWMPVFLKSALAQNLGDEDWIVKTHTMINMLSLPLDYDLTSAVAANLNDDHWPVRMTALYLLSKNRDGGFSKVLDWTVKSDPSELVREMAIALEGKEIIVEEVEEKMEEEVEAEDEI